MPISINGTGSITGLSAGGLPDASVTADDIASNAVTTAKVNDAAITYSKLASNAVTTANVNDASITYSKLSTSATEADNVAKRTAKAWVNFNGTGTVAIRDDFNVSSITDNNTGDYTINFSSNMSSANYSISGVCQATTSGRGVGISAYIVNAAATTQAPTTSSFRVAAVQQTNVAFDSAYVMINVFE